MFGFSDLTKENKGGQCKYIQTEKERARSFIIDSVDILMIVCGISGSRRVVAQNLKFGKES